MAKEWKLTSSLVEAATGAPPPEADPPPQTMEVGRDVGAVIQALAVLRAIGSARQPVSLAAISRTTGVSPSTSLNIVRTLVNEGVVLFNPAAKTYQLGLGMLELAGPLLVRSDVELAHPLLQQIASRYSATATIWLVRHGGRLLLVSKLLPESVVHIEFSVASRLPPYAGATGAAVAAVRGVGMDDLRKGIEKIHWANPPTAEQFIRQVSDAREQGYAVDEGRLIPSVTSVASVVCAHKSDPRLVLSAHLFQGQLSTEELRTLGGELRELGLKVGSLAYGNA